MEDGAHTACPCQVKQILRCVGVYTSLSLPADWRGLASLHIKWTEVIIGFSLTANEENAGNAHLTETLIVRLYFQNETNMYFKGNSSCHRYCDLKTFFWRTLIQHMEPFNPSSPQRLTLSRSCKSTQIMMIWMRPHLVLCDAVDGSTVGVRQHRGDRPSVHVKDLNGAIGTRYQNDVWGRA